MILKYTCWCCKLLRRLQLWSTVITGFRSSQNIGGQKCTEWQPPHWLWVATSQNYKLQASFRLLKLNLNTHKDNISKSMHLNTASWISRLQTPPMTCPFCPSPTTGETLDHFLGTCPGLWVVHSWHLHSEGYHPSFPPDKKHLDTGLNIWAFWHALAKQACTFCFKLIHYKQQIYNSRNIQASKLFLPPLKVRFLGFHSFLLPMTLQKLFNKLLAH